MAALFKGSQLGFGPELPGQLDWLQRQPLAQLPHGPSPIATEQAQLQAHGPQLSNGGLGIGTGLIGHQHQPKQLLIPGHRQQ